MTLEEKYSLLMDLAKLLRKYDADTFETLARDLDSLEFTERLSSILKTSAKVYRRKSYDEGQSFDRKLKKMTLGEPRKFELLTLLERNLQSKMVLPTLKELKRFAADSSLPEIKSDSRSKAIYPFIRVLAGLPTDRLEKLLSNLHEQVPTEDELSKWSDIITKKMSRTEK